MDAGFGKQCAAVLER